MNIAAKKYEFTFDEFCVLVKDGQKADLIDGVIYMASPENLQANELFGWLFSLLTLYVQQKDLGQVYGTRVGFRLDDKNAPEPDIAFATKERAQHKGGHFEGAPDLALEIVTPDSKQRDYELKRQLYERFGVQEYWIIDELKEQITVYALNKQKQYRQRRPKKGIFTSQIIPGFWLRPEWLWQRPLPSLLETLQEITASTDKT